ncbi:hemerythrin domain-containing protein [Geitlerinema splendidum]|nr:hemerythrin domain-containing protein [Geitlerinema splendidum]
MVKTLEDTKRQAIAMKLADLKALQKLIVENDEKLASSINDGEIRDRLRSMLEDDRKNLGIIETTIVQYGNPGEASSTVQKLVEKTQGMMSGNELNIYEKVAQHELLKHSQVMSGLIIHKAGQVVGADIQAAIAPLNAVNFENRAHQEQLKGVLEILGTRELTGMEPDQSVWGRVQDAVAALTGVFGGPASHAKEDINITEIITMDHRKTDTLFMEIANSNDPQKLQEYFGQLFKDLTAHAEAEEEIVYPAVRSYYPDTQELYDEQSEMKRMLAEIKALSPSAPEFKQKIDQLKNMVQHHVREEENDMFPKLRQNFSEQQMQELSDQFKKAKARIQQKMAS